MDPAALALPLVAGAVAAVNPCGFALLPAYLAVLVTRAVDDAGGRTAATARALRFTAGMTLGFVVVFGAFALVVAPLALAVERWLPVLTVVLGVVLVAVGAWLLAGRSLWVPGLHLGGTAPDRTWLSQVGYGVTFALVSLSCTVGPFLAVTSTALRTGSVPGVVAAFLAYAVGMGAVVGVVAVAAATAGSTLAGRLRRATPVISRLSGALLVLAGAYVGWYGWFELRVLAGTATGDPVIAAAVEVQSALTRALTSAGVTGVAIAAVLVALAAALAVLGRRRARHPADDATGPPSATAGRPAGAPAERPDPTP